MIQMAAFRIRHEIKKWLYENKFHLPNISNIKLIPGIYKLKLHSNLFLRQLYLENSKKTDFVIEDSLYFCYKNKPIELIDFNIEESGKSNKQYYYLCLTTKNPDPTTGQTVAYSDKKWKFEMPEKIETESVVFDKYFQTVSTDQVEAKYI